MPRIPRVTEVSPVAERIMRSLGPATPVEEVDGVPPVTDAGGAPEPTNADIRAWAADNWDGEVSASGPVPKAVREAYTAALS